MSLSKFKKTRNTVLAFGCLFALSASAPVVAENLLQVYQDAKKNDLQLTISETGLLATLEKTRQARSALKPRLDLNADASYNLHYQGRTIRGEDRNATLNLGYDLTLSKPLINKKYNAEVARADALVLKEKAAVEVVRENLILRVAEYYFSFLNAKETLALRKSEKGAISRQLNQVKAYFDAGRSAITDVKEAQARYDLTNAQVIAAQQGIDVARESLRAITTRYYKDLKGAPNNIPLVTPKPNNIDTWSTLALANNKQLVVEQQTINIAQKGVDAERAVRAPTIDIFAKHSGGSSFGEDAFDRDQLDGTIGLNFKMNIFEGGAISSRIREARHSLQQARQKLELQKRLTTQQTRAAYLTTLSGLSQIKAYKQALNSTQAAAKATQAGFEAGTRTAVDVLLALQETYSSQRNYSKARYDFLLSTLKLKQASGTLSEKDVAGLSKLLTK